MPAETILGMDDNNWDHLLESLEEEKCVVCIGPEVYCTQESGRFETKLASYLREKEEEIRIRVYDDGWFHYLPDASEIDAWQRVKEFYRLPNVKAEDKLKKISQIPFHFLLHFTPGYQLRDAFEKQNFAYNFLSYLKRDPFNPSEEANQVKPTKLKPLIYNLVGEIKKRNSLVMTYNDFYVYLESIFENKSMAPVLQENIWESEYFIFLGMPFDKWYIHMFMRILHQHEQNRKSKKYAANIFLSDDITTHCAEQYTMTFVPTGIEAFLDVFHQKCQGKGNTENSRRSRKTGDPLQAIGRLGKKK